MLLTLACAMQIIAHKQAGVHRILPGDSSYLDLATVNQLDRGVGYIASFPERQAFSESVLWQALLFIAVKIFKDTVVAAYLVGFACSIGVLLVAISIARRMLGFQPYVFAAACVLAISPALTTAATTGGALSMAMLLVMLSVKRHLEGLSGKGLVLPVSSAIYIGLAMLIRVEFIVLWLVMCLHAGLSVLFKWRNDIKPALVGIQAASGLVVCFIVLWPIVHLNMQLISVPWPVSVGSDIVVEAGGNVAGEVSAAMVARVLDGYLYLLDGSNVFGLVEFLVLLLGLMMLLYAGMAEKKKRVLLLPLFVVALVPGLYGLLSVFTGPDGKYVVLNAFVPFFLITGIFGVFRLPGVIHPKSKWAVGLAIALVVVMGVRTSLNERKNIAERDAMLDWQSRYHGLIGEVNESRTVCMTDRAGYPAFLNRQHVVDLGGRSSIAVLRCVNDAGQLDDEKTLELARAREPDLLVLWEEENYALASRIERLLGRSAVSDLTGPEGHPLVFRINWTTRN